MAHDSTRESEAKGPAVAAVPERWAPYVEGWRRRGAAPEETDHQLAEQAWEEVRRAARLLVEEFGVTRVVVFGSLARGRFREGSDIDLAVEGLPPSEFIRADARLAWELSLPIDLKPLDECSPLLRRHIDEDGIELA